MITQRRIAVVMLTSVVMLSSSFLFSQSSSQQTQSANDKDIELLRKDIRSEKKQIIAANITLTDKEAEQFWPIYDQYTAELTTINDQKLSAIKQYAQGYDTLADNQALDLTTQLLGVDQSIAQLRQKYMPIVAKVISGKKTALFFQIDHRLGLVIDLQLASAIPLVEP
jgi:hypothetical protein